MNSRGMPPAICVEISMDELRRAAAVKECAEAPRPVRPRLRISRPLRTDKETAEQRQQSSAESVVEKQ